MTPDTPASTDTALVVRNDQESRFELLMDGELAGVILFQVRKGLVLMIHTELLPEFEGRGLAAVLAHGALQLARDAGDQVLPYCPYVRGYLRKHPEEADVVPLNRRKDFGLPRGS